MSTLRPRFALPLCLLGGLVWTAPAFAAGFSTARFGGEHGTPLTSNPTAIFYNPAGIAESEGYHIFIDGSLALRGVSYTHDAASTDDTTVPGANTGKATLFNVAAAPMIGASAKFGDFGVGLGFFVPFGGAAVWDHNKDFEDSKQYPGPVDGVQRWHAIEGTLQVSYFSLAAAYRIPSIRLSLGVAGNLIRSELNTIRARNGDGGNVVADEGRSLVEASGTQGSFAVGALFEAVPRKLWIGASYQAQPNVGGGMTLKGTLTNNLNGTVQTPTDVELHQDFPDIVRLGGRFVPKEGIELRLFGDYTRWSVLKNQCLTHPDKDCEINADGSSALATPDDVNGGAIQNIVRNWNDTFGVRAGASYWAVPAVELFGGLGFDSSAIPDETLDPSVTDANKVTASVGGRFELIKQLHLAASYTHIFYLNRDTTGKSTSAKLSPLSISPDSGGAYAQTVGVLNVNLDVGF